jgi:hypothetical protein
MPRQNAPQKTPAPSAPLVGQPSAQQYKIFQAQQKELQRQMEEVQDRRSELSGSLDGKSGADRTGIESRITGLDQRLVQIDADLTQVGKELAASAPGSLVDPAPPPPYGGYNGDDLWSAGFGGAAVMFAIFVPFIVRNRFRRNRQKAQPVTPIPGVADPRIDRMEQAIDTIAVEIERVSENQRFMTRLLTETQLAGTIAAVRGSAEAAKLAVEGPDGR